MAPQQPVRTFSTGGGSCSLAGFLNCSTEGGYDIFDAILGEPGTYLALDMYGNLGFGFSEELWVQSKNYLDEEIPKLRANQAAGNITSFDANPALTVWTQDYGGLFTTTMGLIPDKLMVVADYLSLIGQLTLKEQYAYSLGRYDLAFARRRDLVPFALLLAEEQNALAEESLATFDVH
jgi:hypothetical protein